jgi:hypothetical protein
MKNCLAGVKSCYLVLLCVATLGYVGHSRAQAISPGKIAPPDVVQQLQGTPVVVVGNTAVRPLTSNQIAPPASSAPEVPSAKASDTPAGRSTLVVRASDNLVGLSTNDLVVIYPDTAAIVAAAGGEHDSAKAYPEMGIVVIHVPSFDRLLPLQQTLAARFPAAKFDLPVTYFPLRSK